MFTKHMGKAPKGGQTVNNAGKGSQVKPLGAHNNVGTSGSGMPGAGINNYAKATPMASPGAPPAAGGGLAPTSPAPAPPNTGLGSGTFPGVTG